MRAGHLRKFVKWKQYMTSETWSRPVCMVPPADVSRVARWRPAVRPRCFKEKTRLMAWIDKFETNLAHSHDDSYLNHKPELDILRQTINGEIPEYADGPNIDVIIADIIRVGQGTHTAAALTAPILPHDAIVAGQ